MTFHFCTYQGEVRIGEYCSSPFIFSYLLFDNLSKKPKASSVGQKKKKKKKNKQKYKRLKTKQKERPIFTIKGSKKLVQERCLFQNLRAAWCIFICACVTNTKVADYRQLAFVTTSNENNKDFLHDQHTNPI